MDHLLRVELGAALRYPMLRRYDRSISSFSRHWFVLWRKVMMLFKEMLSPESETQTEVIGKIGWNSAALRGKFQLKRLPIFASLALPQPAPSIGWFHYHSRRRQQSNQPPQHQRHNCIDIHCQSALPANISSSVIYSIRIAIHLHSIASCPPSLSFIIANQEWVV